MCARQRVAGRGHGQRPPGARGAVGAAVVGAWLPVRRRRGRGERVAPHLGGLRSALERGDLLVVQLPLRGERSEVATVGRPASARASRRSPRACGCAAASRGLASRQDARRAAVSEARGATSICVDDVLALRRHPAQVVEARERLVEALRAEDDLERLDVALLVQQPEAGCELPLGDRDCRGARSRAACGQVGALGPQRARGCGRARRVASAAATSRWSSEYSCRTAERERERQRSFWACSDGAECDGPAPSRVRAPPGRPGRWRRTAKQRRRGVCACPSTERDRTRFREGTHLPTENWVCFATISADLG